MMRPFFFLFVFLSLLLLLGSPASAKVTVKISGDAELKLGSPSGEKEIERMINEGLKKMGEKNPGALAFFNSGQTIKIICYGSKKAKELGIKKPEAEMFTQSWGETVGDFNKDGSPKKGGTTYIVLDCDYFLKYRWYKKFVFFGVKQSMWDILVHELLHATHRDREHAEGKDSLEIYQKWVTAFNASIKKLYKETVKIDKERGYLRLSKEWLDKFVAALREEIMEKRVPEKKTQTGGNKSSSSSKGGSSTTTPQNNQNQNNQNQNNQDQKNQNNQNQDSNQQSGSGVINLDAYVKYALDEGPDPTEDNFTVAIGISMTPYENPRFFNGFSGNVPFTPTDMLPPPVDPVKDDKVSFEIGARYAIQKHFAVGFTYDWEEKGKGDLQNVEEADIGNFLGNLNYRFSVGRGFDASIIEIPWTNLFGRQPVKVDVFINNYENNIVYFTPTANTWRIGERYTEESGNTVEWNTLNYGTQVQGDLQVPPNIQTGLLWVSPDEVLGVGPNAGTNIAPAPGLDPKDWPHAEGQLLPSVKIEVKR